MEEQFKTSRCVLVLLVYCLALSAPATAESLSNDQITAEFNETGLVSITDKHLSKSIEFKKDNFSFSKTDCRATTVFFLNT